MKPLTRHPANKHSSSKRFNKASRKVKALNAPGLARGGFRL